MLKSVQPATAYYFAWFLVVVPVIGRSPSLENTLMDIALGNSSEVVSQKKTPTPLLWSVVEYIN